MNNNDMSEGDDEGIFRRK
jgi:hypothetical protein